MPKLVSVTDVVRSFSDIVSRVYYKGETFDIKKGANIVARLSPAKPKSTIAVADLNNFFREIPKLDVEDSKEFEKTIKEMRLLKDKKVFNKWD
jgi:antitoxin (DNA-binding transcriptional repressor) of toxin-antitoxin stability system